MLSIGEFAHAAMLSVKTIRYYHEMEILFPVKIERESGYRYYDQSSFHRVKTIQVLKELGFTIKEIRNILKECRDDNDLFTFIEDKIDDVEKKIQQLHLTKNKLLKQKITALTGQQKNGEILEFTFEIPCYVSKKIIGTYKQIGEAFSFLYKQYGQFTIGKPYSLYNEFGYSEEETLLEGIIALEANAPIKEECKHSFPKTKAIKIIHKGSYGTQGSSYFQLFNYCKEKNYKIKLPVIEHYVKDPGMLFPVEPENYKTECIILIEE